MKDYEGKGGREAVAARRARALLRHATCEEARGQCRILGPAPIDDMRIRL